MDDLARRLGDKVTRPEPLPRQTGHVWFEPPPAVQSLGEIDLTDHEKFRAELVESRSPHGLRRQPARDAEAKGGKPWMPRPNSYVLFQPRPTSGPCDRASLHQSQMTARNNAVSQRGISTRHGQSRLRNSLGENNAGTHAKPDGLTALAISSWLPPRPTRRRNTIPAPPTPGPPRGFVFR